jgi:hypothetical protein
MLETAGRRCSAVQAAETDRPKAAPCEIDRRRREASDFSAKIKLGVISPAQEFPAAIV